MGQSRKSELSQEEIVKCLEYLRNHYALTAFQEKESELYNSKIQKYIIYALRDDESLLEMKRAGARLHLATLELNRRCENISDIPTHAKRLHEMDSKLFQDFANLVDAQREVIDCLRNPAPSAKVKEDDAKTLYNSTKRTTLKEEQTLLNLLKLEGVDDITISAVSNQAFEEIASDDWECKLDF